MTIGSHLAQHSPHLAGSPTTGDTPVSPTAAVNSSIIPSSGYGDSVTGRDPSLLQTPPAINFNEVINIFEPDQVLPVQNDKDVTMPQVGSTMCLLSMDCLSYLYDVAVRRSLC